MIAENRTRLTRLGLADNVTYLQADLFTWQPDRQYDAIVMGFFLSHVPDDLLDPFLATVSSALKPGGRLFLVDSRHTQTSSRPDSPYSDLDNPLTVRHLNDGRAFTIYKLFRNPANLEAAFARHNITFSGEETDEYFVFGFGEKGENYRRLCKNEERSFTSFRKNDLWEEALLPSPKPFFLSPAKDLPERSGGVVATVALPIACRLVLAAHS